MTDSGSQGSRLAEFRNRYNSAISGLLHSISLDEGFVKYPTLEEFDINALATGPGSNFNRLVTICDTLYSGEKRVVGRPPALEEITAELDRILATDYPLDHPRVPERLEKLRLKISDLKEALPEFLELTRAVAQEHTARLLGRDGPSSNGHVR